MAGLEVNVGNVTKGVSGVELGDGSIAGLVVSANGGNFTPSSYDADLTMDGSAQSGPIATGATKIQFCNLGATTEAIRVAFGSTALIAEGNLTHSTDHATTGYYIPALADAGAGACVVLNVPSAAIGGFYAVENAVSGDVQVVTVNHGV